MQSASDFLLQKALEAAEEKGAVTNSIRLADYNILPCIGCQNCIKWPPQPCPLNKKPEDQYMEVCNLLDKSDAFIFSFPNYGFHIPPILTTLFTRAPYLDETRKLPIEYNYDQVHRVKGFIVSGKVAGVICISTGIGSEIPISHLSSPFISAKLTIVASAGISIFEHNSYHPGFKKQPWVKDIEDADFAIDMARGVGKRVVSGSSAFGPITDGVLQSSSICQNIYRMPEFTLPDLSGSIRSGDEFTNTRSIFIFGGREASEQVKSFKNALDGEYKDVLNEGKVKLQLFILIPKVPEFITKDFISEETLKGGVPANAIMCWDYACKDSFIVEDNASAYILLVNKDGEIFYNFCGQYTGENFEKVKSMINESFIDN
jgi:multimeric flavodoxin WrbA